MRGAVFAFEDYHFAAETGVLTLAYSCDGVAFEEVWTFPKPSENYSAKAFDRAAFGLWIMAGVSYYKARLAAKIVLKKGALNAAQRAFFAEAYQRGLGEFFYQNALDPAMEIPFPEAQEVAPGAVKLPANTGALVALGGGKDSLVTATSLLSAGENITTWTVGHREILAPQVAKLGAPHLTIDRKISANLIAENAAGAYNGHIPISAILAFAGVCAAVLTGKKDVVLSNEASANECNTVYRGIAINHQWSKTLRFEQIFSQYVRREISPDVRYFSFLRALSEFQIAEIFCRKCFTPFTERFSSCNRNFKIGNKRPLSWCGACPKCAFVAAIFAPFLPPEKLWALFAGKDLFADEALKETFEELMGTRNVKPFECVGEHQEVRHALRRAQITHESLRDWTIPEDDFDPYAMRPHELPPRYFEILTAQLP